MAVNIGTRDQYARLAWGEPVSRALPCVYQLIQHTMTRTKTSSTPITNTFTPLELQDAQGYMEVCVNSSYTSRIGAGEWDNDEVVPCAECGASAGQYHCIGCESEICPECGKPFRRCKDYIGFE